MYISHIVGTKMSDLWETFILIRSFYDLLIKELIIALIYVKYSI